MTVDELKHCIRPVIFDLENDVASYSTQGTSFGVRFDDDFFIITLKHVISSVPTKNILFPYGGKHEKAYLEFLPIDRRLVFENKNNDDDTDKYELVAFRVDKTKIKDSIFDTNSFVKIYKKYINYNDFDMLLILKVARWLAYLHIFLCQGHQLFHLEMVNLIEFVLQQVVLLKHKFCQ